MDFNELQSNWKKSGTEKKSQTALQMMTKVGNHPKFKRIKMKLIIETVLLIVFLIVYHDIFDGQNKSLWINIALVTSALLFVLTDILGFFTLQNLIKGNNLKASLQKLMVRLKQLATLSVVMALFFGSSIILFFMSTVDFTRNKYLLLGGMLITMIIFIGLSYRNWLYRISQIKEAGMEFEENTFGE